MSKRRREWKESLKKDFESDQPKREKKQNIGILKDETYINVEGKLVLVRSQNDAVETAMKQSNKNKNKILKESNKIQLMTPRQSSQNHSVKNLTPTFRKPENFLTETNKVMNYVTSVKMCPSASEMQLLDNLTDTTTYFVEAVEEHKSSECENFSKALSHNDQHSKTNIAEELEPQYSSDSQQSDMNNCKVLEKDHQNETYSHTFNDECETGNSTQNLTGIDEHETFYDPSDSGERDFSSGLKNKISRRKLNFASNSNIKNEKDKTINHDETISKNEENQNYVSDNKERNMTLTDNNNKCLLPVQEKEANRNLNMKQIIDNISDLITIKCEEIEATKDQRDQSAKGIIIKESKIQNVNVINEENGDHCLQEVNAEIDFSPRNDFDRSFEVIHAEIHSEPLMKKNRPSDSNTCEKIVIKYDINDEIVSALEEDILFEKSNNSETKETVSGNDIKQDSNTNKTESTNKVIEKRNKKSKRLKRNAHYNKSYLDYMSDDDLDQLLLNEAFPSESSDEVIYTEESSTLSSNSDDKDKPAKKKKKGMKKNPKKINEHDISATKKQTKASNKKENITKKKKGESYTNYKGKEVEGKSIKPNPCVGKNCGNDCGNISEERRQSLFSYFWNLNCHQRRKDWVAQCAVKKTVKRPKKNSSVRGCTYDYFINEGEGRRKVCQKYLISTLDITQRFILYTLETMSDGFAKSDDRGKNGGQNKTKEEVIEHAKRFIESLPMLPSHYCRKDSKRLYFPSEFKNITNLHRIYKDNCKEYGIKGMSFQVFRIWFNNSYNIGFHVPKKDKCTMCSYEKKNEENKEKIEKHFEEKNESYKRFKYHQNVHKNDKSILCASFDMQKVLNTPHGESMMLYYSRKLAVYDFTIYESVTRKVYCCIWTEADANRGGNEISTCLYNYINEVDARGSVRTLLMYCDSCFGQNKNKIVLSMIRYALSKCTNLTTIQINYLIPGHTYMPVDSVHATIENKIKKNTVWAPSQWPTIIEVARQDPEPYKVEVLNSKDFIGFSEVVNATFKKTQKISISKLNVATFRKQNLNVMYTKYSMLPDAETSNISLLTLSNNVKLNTKLYPTQLGISAIKYKDLMKLVDKNIIPERFHAEYKNLKINNKVKDLLVETDEEDDIENQEDN